MSKFIEKIDHLLEVVKRKEVKGAEVYIVSWDARYGDYYDNTQRVAKAFLLKGDAIAFKKSLEDAQELLQNTTNIRITIRKQQ